MYFGGDVIMDALRTIVTAVANVEELRFSSGVDGFQT